MCGIGGIVSRKEVGVKELEEMKKEMKRRGPDMDGIYLSKDKKVGLVSTRLAIIDLSENGKQPMENEDKTLWLVFNGEIYNYKELRKKLSQLGHVFKSNTDTEVILHLYEELGEDCVHKLRGMFAFCIWDEKERKLFLAQDRLGIKFLYYYFDGIDFIFASSLKAILKCKQVERKIDPKGVIGFLSLGYVPAPITMVKGIKNLLPGHCLVVKGGDIFLKKYWDLCWVRIREKKRYQEMITQLYNQLNQTVKFHLISDVPIGIFLSGGLDSSTITALVAKHTSKVKTFTLLFNEKKYDERKFARLISKKFNTQHIETLITPQMVFDELHKIFSFMELPTIDGINTYFVSKLAKEEGIKVCLSGLGGDELFGGYHSFKRGLLVYKLVHTPVLRYSLKFPFFKSHSKYNFSPLMEKPTLMRWYFTMRKLFYPHEIQSLLSKKWFPIEGEKFIRKTNIKSEDLGDKIRELEIKNYMYNQLLRDTDTMGMGNSVEVRVPFLDHQFIEFILSVCNEKFLSKELLKKTMSFILPKEILKRRKKPFTFPFAEWLHFYSHKLITPLLRSNFLFNSDAVKVEYKNFYHHKSSWQRIWGITVLEEWVKLMKLGI